MIYLVKYCWLSNQTTSPFAVQSDQIIKKIILIILIIVCFTSTGAAGWEEPAPVDCTGWWWRLVLADWDDWKSVWWSRLGKTKPSPLWSSPNIWNTEKRVSGSHWNSKILEELTWNDDVNRNHWDSSEWGTVRGNSHKVFACPHLLLF